MRRAITNHILPIVAGILVLASAAFAGERPRPGAGGNNSTLHPLAPQTQVQPADVFQILQCLIGPDATVTNAVLNAAPGAAGLFTGGSPVFGIDQGIVLSSGNIVTIVGPNLLNDTSYDNGLPGDPDLDGLIPGYTTFDAATLEFDFTCGQSATVSFQFVFASEEYNEWVGSEFNDVFGFFLNGVNIAIVPATCSNPGIPVAINNVDCQNPFNPPGGPNCGCYRNNELNTVGGGLIDTEMDGMTQVFYAVATIPPGTNHMKIAIADAGDRVLDSNVMIHCQSFTCGAPPTIGGCCIEDDCFLLGADQCAAQGGTYLGDGVTCGPEDPCHPPVPAIPTTWGAIKTLHR